jgi:hypothetical protein
VQPTSARLAGQVLPRVDPTGLPLRPDKDAKGIEWTGTAPAEQFPDAPLVADWESASPWYCVEVARDLFGSCVLTRSWGGRASHRRGSMLELVTDISEARARIAEIERRRYRSGAAYVQVA